MSSTLNKINILVKGLWKVHIFIRIRIYESYKINNKISHIRYLLIYAYQVFIQHDFNKQNKILFYGNITLSFFHDLCPPSN
jgi:hypothetical protein